MEITECVCMCVKLAYLLYILCLSIQDEFYILLNGFLHWSNVYFAFLCELVSFSDSFSLSISACVNGKVRALVYTLLFLSVLVVLIVVVFLEKLCIRPLETAHELTTTMTTTSSVAICKAIFVRQLTIFMADFFLLLLLLLSLSLDSFVRYTRSLAFVG